VQVRCGRRSAEYALEGQKNFLKKIDFRNAHILYFICEPFYVIHGRRPLRPPGASILDGLIAVAVTLPGAVAVLACVNALFLSAARVCDTGLGGVFVKRRELTKLECNDIINSIFCQLFTHVTRCKYTSYEAPPPPPIFIAFLGAYMPLNQRLAVGETFLSAPKQCAVNALKTRFTGVRFLT